MYVRSMVGDGVLEELAAVPPGPELAARLAGVDPSRLPGDRVVEVLRAQSRQCAHEQARLWAALVAVGLAVPADDRGAPDDVDGARARAVRVADRAPGEVAAALTWTHRTAERELHLAEVVVRGLPAVCAALSTGRIDRGKAVVFAEYLDPAYGVTSAQTAAILARLLPVAPTLTTSQLRGRLWRALLAVDPEWARRRYTRAVRGRTVTAVLADNGTVTVTGSGLPAGEAAVACARVDRLAEAAKRAGHGGPVGQIAADVFLGLLDGRFHGRSEEQIVSALLGDRRPEDARADGHGDTARADGRPEEPNDERAAAGDPGGDDDPGAGTQARTGIEIRVGLTTLLGLDQRPGEIPGLGPVLAPVARTTVARQRQGAQWRFAVTDPDGHLVLAGVTRRRPRPDEPTATASGDGQRCRGGIVELHVSSVELEQLAGEPTDPLGGWADVVADIAAQYADRHAMLAGLDDRPSGRFPGAALARHVQVRDRTCSHPGCRRPARHCDLDHTHDHARGGATVRVNLGPGCARHHMFKHELGWRLAQPRSGEFVWTSPLGQVYRTRGGPIAPPLPEPLPRPDEPPEAEGRRYGGPILLLTDPKRPREARPPPGPAEPDEPPPF